jgi:hypothetical protein
MLACNTLTDEDRARLAHVRAKYGDRYEFSTSDVYLSVRARHAGATAWEDWMAIYKDFWLAGQEPRASSALAYMNVYDIQGVWQGQFFWDPNAHQIEFSHSKEHY